MRDPPSGRRRRRLRPWYAPQPPYCVRGRSREAVERARSHRVDLVLMDIRMPDLDGLAATRLITGDEDLAGVRILARGSEDRAQLAIIAYQTGLAPR
ncbi:response regulator [Streptomyces platensis]|uniref:response regulator n=1 Tax=Streptomyces platensis TaxID=58346 RepID=UPI00386347B9